MHLTEKPSGDKKLMLRKILLIFVTLIIVAETIKFVLLRYIPIKLIAVVPAVPELPYQPSQTR
jgi:hypothetical protein